MQNHAELYRQAHKPGLTQLELAELSAHCYALWSSDFQTQPVRIYLVGAPGAGTAFLTRKLDEDNASTQSRDLLTLVATYETGKVVSRTATAMTRLLDQAHPQYALESNPPVKSTITERSLLLTYLASLFVANHPDHMGFTGTHAELLGWGRRQQVVSEGEYAQYLPGDGSCSCC